MHYQIKHLKYFSPDGKDKLPNGVYFQKGGFIHECHINAHKFEIPITGYSLKSGIISVTEMSIFSAITVLPNDTNISEETIFNWLKNEFMLLNTDEFSFSIGKFFYGTFGDGFDEHSTCVLHFMNWQLVVIITHKILSHFHFQNALIKDFQSEKIFLMVTNH